MATRRKRGLKAEIWLGATQPTGTLPIVLFVPSHDRDGRDIDHDYWVTRALETLGTLFRGATAYRALVVCGATTSEKASYAMKSRPLLPAMPIRRP